MLDDTAGFDAFGHRFSSRVANWKDDLRDLEHEGATYEHWLLDEEDGGPGIYRVRFSPADTHRYVRGVVGWDEYLYGGFDAVSDRALAAEAAASAEERKAVGSDGVCAADFLGDDVETLVCGMRPEKAERVRPEGLSSDPFVILNEIASSLPIAARTLTDRGDQRASFPVADERDVQDLVFFLMRCLWSDARREEPTPSSAGNTKRADIAVPSQQTLVEIKYARDARHAKGIADELRIDIESYHTHPACRFLFCLVWDPQRHLVDPHQLERDLSAPRTKGQAAFDVVVRVV
jgi:hypothetical protein